LAFELTVNVTLVAVFETVPPEDDAVSQLGSPEI
jgi:hypothetical protein